jgi:hypothetical protein
VIVREHGGYDRLLIEDVDDLIWDLEQGFARARAAGGEG